MDNNICEECYWYELEQQYCIFHGCYLVPDENCGAFEPMKGESK